MARLTVKEFCDEYSWSVQELSDRSNLDLPRAEAIYYGRWTASPAERQSIADALELDVESIAWGHQIFPKPFYGHGPS